MKARAPLITIAAVTLNLGYSAFLHTRVAALEARTGRQAAAVTPERASPTMRAAPAVLRLTQAGSAGIAEVEADTDDAATTTDAQSEISSAIEELKSEMSAGTCTELESRLDDLESEIDTKIEAAVQDHESSSGHTTD